MPGGPRLIGRCAVIVWKLQYFSDWANGRKIALDTDRNGVVLVRIRKR